MSAMGERMQKWYEGFKYQSIIQEINILHKFSLNTYLLTEGRKEQRKMAWPQNWWFTNDIDRPDSYPPPGAEQLLHAMPCCNC